MKTLENMTSKKSDAIAVLQAYRAAKFSAFEQGMIMGYVDALRSTEKLMREIRKEVRV